MRILILEINRKVRGILGFSAPLCCPKFSYDVITFLYVKLDAKLDHNPRYVWRSIHASQVFVKRGIRWRIGDGANNNVWRQPWLRMKIKLLLLL
jgi:hypothetical protein